MASAPIFAQVSSFGEHKAMIACLSDTGTLSVNYMGTSPPSSSVVSEAKDINYDEIDEEHRKLLAAQICGLAPRPRTNREFLKAGSF